MDKGRSVMLKVVRIFEIILAILILLLVLFGTWDIINLIVDTYILKPDIRVTYEEFKNILSQVFLLIIGVEIAGMFYLHLPETVIEILIFAIARKVILLPKTGTMIDVFFGVLAICALFTIKKYFIEKDTYNT